MDGNGKVVILTDTLCADLSLLWHGVPFVLNGEPKVLEAFFVVGSADWLAARALGYGPESTSALQPCGECDWQKTQPVTLEGKVAKTHAANLKAARDILKCGDATMAKRKTMMQAAMINKLTCALDYVPGADSVEGVPPDTMHVWLAGLSRVEGSWKDKVLLTNGARCAITDPRLLTRDS